MFQRASEDEEGKEEKMISVYEEPYFKLWAESKCCTILFRDPDTLQDKIEGQRQRNQHSRIEKKNSCRASSYFPECDDNSLQSQGPID